MKVLVACEFSGVVRDAFIAAGHDAISCDILDTEVPGPHIKGNIYDVSLFGYDLLIAHPPCTYLTNAGVRHLHDNVSTRNGTIAAVSGSARWVEMFKAAEFFNYFKNAPVERIAIENPVPHKYAKALIGQYDQLVRPYYFGNPETKAICWWLKNLPFLQSTNYISERVHNVHMMSPGPNRAKDRSRFFPEVAKAMAEQWGTK